MWSSYDGNSIYETEASQTQREFETEALNHDASSIQVLENYINDYSLMKSPSRVDPECRESLRQHL